MKLSRETCRWSLQEQFREKTIIVLEIRLKPCTLHLRYICTYTYRAIFLKTNLMKFAVIWVKRCQKAGFLGPISSKIALAKEKERRKRKSGEEERRRRGKNSGCTESLSFYNGYFENCWTQKVRLVVMFSKTQPDTYVYVRIGRSCMKWYLPITDVQMLYN